MSNPEARIQTYLSNLKNALQGADKATVQDALSDAEEHLRGALAEEAAAAGDEGGTEVLEEIIRQYGDPDEVAEAYRSWEQNALAPALPGRSAPAAGHQTPSRTRDYRGFFQVFADPRTWGGLVYMLIALVTGTLYFSWTVTALATSIGVMILIIGIPVTILFLLSIRGLAFLEGRLVEALLGERMPRRPAFTNPDQPWIQRLKELLLVKVTWLAVIYNLLMLPLGTIYFSVMVTLLATSLALIAAPVGTMIFDLPVAQFGAAQYYLPDYLTPLVAIGGALLLVLTLHLARWVGQVHGKFAKALLVSD